MAMNMKPLDQLGERPTAHAAPEPLVTFVVAVLLGYVPVTADPESVSRALTAPPPAPYTADRVVTSDGGVQDVVPVDLSAQKVTTTEPSERPLRAGDA